MIDGCVELVLCDSIYILRLDKWETPDRKTYLAIYFFNVVLYTEFMTIMICGNGTSRISPHCNLTRLDNSNLAVLIQDPERVSISLEDNAYSLKAVES